MWIYNHSNTIQTKVRNFYLIKNDIFKNYFFRHPYPPFNIHYRYRFHAPHHDTYEVSWVSFTTEKLENYNWNYLDHYICTRGDTDFQLVEAVKFWRFRVYLLPLNNSATKRIIEGGHHCDIYTTPTTLDYTNLVEGFLKIIETVVNKIKRPNAKKPRVCHFIYYYLL